MPRAHRNHVDPDFSAAMDALRLDVVARCGFSITTTRDCQHLKEKMQQVNPLLQIGTSTLRRFFNLLPAKNQFSLSTLNTLARYAGRTGFAHYTELITHRLVAASRVNWELLMQRSFPAAEAPSLKALLEQLESPEYEQVSATFFDQLAGRLMPAYERGLTQADIKRIFEGPRASRFVMEILPPLSWMNGFGKAMFERYLERASTEDERLYALGVLGQAALYSGDLVEARTLVEGLKAPTTGMMHILPSSRVLALQWLFASLQGEAESERKLWGQIQSGYQLKSRHAKAYTPDWEIHFCDITARFLLISGKTHHLERHLEFLRSLRTRPELIVESNHLFPLLDIHETWILCRLGEHDEAVARFQRLDPHGHLPFDRAFGGIAYHAIGERLDPERKEHHLAAREEIARWSGFTWLSEQMCAAH